VQPRTASEDTESTDIDNHEQPTAVVPRPTVSSEDETVSIDLEKDQDFDDTEPENDLNEQPTVVPSRSDAIQDRANIATYRPDSTVESFSDDKNSLTYEPQEPDDSDEPTRVVEPVVGPHLPASFLSHTSDVDRKHASKDRKRRISPKLRASEQPVPEPTPIGRTPRITKAQEPDVEPAIAGSPPAPAGIRERRSARGIAKISAAILAPLLVLGVIGGLAVYMLPTATINIVPREESISSTLTYGLTSASASYDIAIEPDHITGSSTASAVREATGERYEAVGTAAGAIQISNPLTHEVTVPAGTEIPGPQGVMYYTAEDVRIPAADPYGSMSFGSATVGVYAGVIGPDGNLDAGLLTGQLGIQMFYTNHDGIWGGRMEQYAVLTEQDIQAVQEAVASDLVDKARDEFDELIPDGFEIVPGTLQIDDPEIEVSGSAGDDAQEVSASGTIRVEAYVYDPEELHQLAGDEADRQLARQGGSERILLAETVTLKESTNLGSDDPAFQINVEAIARTVITESEREEIIQELTGLSRSEAEASLRNHPKIDRFDIEIEPTWLFDRMPEITSRISLHVSSGEQTASR
jgi:hypothetical protein